MERFDSSKWEIVDFRKPKNGEHFVDRNGVIKVAEHDFVEGMFPIVRERVTDHAWALAAMVRNPMREYAWASFRHRFNPDTPHGFEMAFRGGPWEPAVWNPGDIKSTSWRPCEPEAKPEPTPDGHDWLRSLPDGAEVQLDGLSHYHVKRGGALYPQGKPFSADICNPIGTYPNSGWRLRQKPAPGSREAVAASAEGTCWWESADRVHYLKRISKHIECRATIDGEFSYSKPLSIFLSDAKPGGYEPILDSHGKPGEPKFDPATGTGNQLWADVVRHFPGIAVQHEHSKPEYIEGDDYVYPSGVREKAVPFWFNGDTELTGWYIYKPAPAPSRDAQLNAIESQLLAVVAEVAALKEGK